MCGSYSTDQRKVNGSRCVSVEQTRPIRVRTYGDTRTMGRMSADSRARPKGCTRFRNCQIRGCTRALEFSSSTTPRTCRSKSIEMLKNGTNEFGYEKQSCLAVTERLHDLEDTEATGERRNYCQQEVAVFAAKELQDDRVSGRLPNNETLQGSSTISTVASSMIAWRMMTS